MSIKRYIDEDKMNIDMQKYKNEFNASLEEKVDKEDVPFSFGINKNGNYGYIKHL